jgi:hypothetical protein
MQIPVLSGIYTDENSDFRMSYPRNLMPVPSDQGISQGYLRPADGVVEFSTGANGIDRGGINWDGTCYRVMGSKLVSVSSLGVITEIDDVGSGGQVSLDYSFDYLGVASNLKMYLYDKVTLTQITDVDLGDVVDFIWIDGYFMTTDGEFLVVTELNDPFAVSQLKYGSSEVDPDPVIALEELNNQAYALNRYTIEVFQNIGGIGFPFQRINGAQIPRGVIGTHATTIYMENLVFVGSGRNESPSVYIGSAGQSARIATREIDQLLQEYTEAELSSIVCEARIDKGHQLLYIHLPDQTIVYDGSASRIVSKPVWFTLGTGITGKSIYKARNLVWCYDKWIVGDPTENRLGVLDNSLSSHYGELVGWDFGTIIIYNEGFGFILHLLELVCLTGRAVLGDDSTVWHQYSIDGETWSQEFPIAAGKQGERANRIAWWQNGMRQNWSIERFRGTSDAFLSVARLDARMEALNV